MCSETKAITVYSVYITKFVIFIYICPMYTYFLYVYGAIKVIKKNVGAVGDGTASMTGQHNALQFDSTLYFVHAEGPKVEPHVQQV